MLMNTKTFNEKEIIFREGDAGDYAYIITSGAVEILKHAEHGEVQLAVLESGAVFGEMALFEPRNMRSATARALNKVHVDAIGDTQFKDMINACPAQLQMVFANILNRLRDTNARLAAKERATVILDQAIDSITISSACEKLSFTPVEIKSGTLPYFIGGYPEHEDKPRNNNLDLPSEGPPMMISQKHCAIERHTDGIYLVDQGSRFCTIVNGKPIGRGKISEKAPLLLGENKITLGDHTSPYKLIMKCE